MSWKVFDNNFSEEIKFNSVNNNFKVCFSKSRLYELMKSELDSCNFLLSQAKSKEQLCRIELDSLSKDVQSLKKSVKASELSELQSLRSARDATWSNLQTCISNRIDLQERLTNLTKMKECLSIYSTSQSPLSLMCQKCLGTLLISM
jgi:vacuolar-type H+-ATPase subunit I/STV1